MKDFKKYLKDGRRVAAFGKQIGNEIEVFLLYCSRKDQFKKKYAIRIYNYREYVNNYNYFTYHHPVILRIPIAEGDSAEYTFKKYMRENFYRLKTVYYRVTKSIDYVVNNKEQIQLRGTDKYAVTKLSD